MPRAAIIILLLTSLSNTGQAAPPKLAPGHDVDRTCLGADAKSSTAGLIYLHGLDSVVMSAQEKGNRDVLQRLGDQLQVRIFAPRATTHCKNKAAPLCWPHQNPADRERVWREVTLQSRACIGPHPASGVIGFSNGGYFAASLAQTCPKSEPLWVIGIGSAGLAWGKPQSIDCPPIHLLIGKRDISRGKALDFFQGLQKVQWPSSLEEFADGHVVPEDALRQLLSRILKSPSLVPGSASGTNAKASSTPAP